jgi:sugar/nucleoside kinase (ribokinase family)
MLCTIGDLVEDIVVWLETAPAYGTDTPAQIFRRRGGSAASVAVHAATAGTPARFVGQIGNDRLGRQLVAELEGVGVDVRVGCDGTTGSIVVLVDPSGERTMLPDRAAAMQLADLPAGALDGITWLHVPAYSLVVEPLGATSRKAIAAARTSGASISIDASSTGPIESFGIARFLEMVEKLAPVVFFANDAEAALLGLGRGYPLPGAALTVIKAGAEPVLLLPANGDSAIVPVTPVNVVADTTGAGDAFAAGFITAMMAGAGPTAAAEAGCRKAATVLVQPGAGN